MKFGVDKLLSSEESSVQDVKLENILGPSRDGLWVDDEVLTSVREEEEEEEEEDDSSESDKQSMFYLSNRLLWHVKISLLLLVLCSITTHRSFHLLGSCLRFQISIELTVLSHHRAVLSFRPHVLL